MYAFHRFKNRVGMLQNHPVLRGENDNDVTISYTLCDRIQYEILL